MLQLLPLAQQRKIRTLLNYNPDTAGGLMSPDFLCLSESTPVSNVLEAGRSSTAPPEALAVVFARGDDGRSRHGLGTGIGGHILGDSTGVDVLVVHVSSVSTVR